MKKILFSVALFTLMTPAFAQQDGEELPPNCYQKWGAVFDARGAYEVEDGTYEKVIVSIRLGNSAECYLGKVSVKDGKLGQIYIMLDDGSYKPLDKKYKHNVPVKIVNGISVPRVTVDDEIVSVLFTMNIKPKESQPVVAPDPSDM